MGLASKFRFVPHQVEPLPPERRAGLTNVAHSRPSGGGVGTETFDHAEAVLLENRRTLPGAGENLHSRRVNGDLELRSTVKGTIAPALRIAR